MRGRMPSTTRTAITAAYAAQGLGYAVVVTSLPALKERQHVDDLVVTLIVLGVCVAAAAGSLLADAVAARRGSRSAVVLGLALQAATLPAIALPTPAPVFFAAFAIYGLGLGCVDASSAMQGVLAQRALGSPLLGGFFAGYTAADDRGGALLVAGLTAAVPTGALASGLALIVAALTAAAVAGFGWRRFAVEGAQRTASVSRRERAPLPRRAIWTFGAVILVAFVADSAVSTWSTVYLHDDLGAAAWLAPLGYGAYQVAVLATRLGTDRLLRAWGARMLVATAIGVAAAGCALVASVPSPAAAVVGFALAGVATGALVPAAFGAASDAAPARSDEMIARVNVFTYAGAVGGAVVVGLLADGPGLALGFLVPAIALLALLAGVRAFSPRVPREQSRAASAR